MVYGERSSGMNIDHVRAITDAKGHYRLVGLPLGRDWHVVAVAPVDFPVIWYGKNPHRFSRDQELPYLRHRVPVEASAGPGSIKRDIPLQRGVWVSGRLSMTPESRFAAEVAYSVFTDNPSLEATPVFAGHRPMPILWGGTAYSISSPSSALV